jgi:hypothetical protein
MKRADFQADTGQGVLAKSENMGRSAKAHFWKAHDRFNHYSVSRCGMFYMTRFLAIADHHTPRCKRCEQKS